MSERRFFIDTADYQYISNIWSTKLSKEFHWRDLVGITTNPSAFYKINKLSLSDWIETTEKLCKTLLDIRDGRAGGVVYVQIPNSNLSDREIEEWAKLLNTIGDGLTKVGIKIPPYHYHLKQLFNLNNILSRNTNVTGVADVGTALCACAKRPAYVSIIPGRMEENGIDARSQISYLMASKPSTTHIITGSMRTTDGLKWACQYGTVPTIGTKVLDMIDVAEMAHYWDAKTFTVPEYCPPITLNQTELSKSFFKQMDEFGQKACDDFKTLIK